MCVCLFVLVRSKVREMGGVIVRERKGEEGRENESSGRRERGKG